MSKAVNALSLSLAAFSFCFGVPNALAKPMQIQDKQSATQQHIDPPHGPEEPVLIGTPPKQQEPSSVNHHVHHKSAAASTQDSALNRAANQNRDKENPRDKDPKAGIKNTR
jgi:hypothetical protein